MKIRSFTKEDILFTEVINDLGFKVVLANLGASIYLVRDHQYVLNRSIYNIKDFKEKDCYYGKTIGRVSNRMRGHKIRLGDKLYEISPNESNNVLHGGLNGVSNLYFDVKTNVINNLIYVTYRKVVLEKEDGYPGDLDLTVTYIVPVNENRIEIKYSAKSNKDTVLSLTNHAYWTLGCNSINGLAIKIPASKYLKTDEDLLPIEYHDVNEALDFRNFKNIGKDIDDSCLHLSRLNGYDHFYLLDTKDGLSCVLKNKLYEMKVESSFEGLQIYTHGFDSHYRLYPECLPLLNSVAIEPSNSFMKLHFLRANEEYNEYIRYSFLKLEQ